MGKTNTELNQGLNHKSDTFIKKLDSNMHFKSNTATGGVRFDWINEIEFACPYIDNVVRNPKLALIKEEDIVKVEKAKSVSVASVKNLSTHTHYIEKVDEVTEDVQPSKLLIERSEETFNIYENRFLYTLIYNISRFVVKKEDELNNIDIYDDKVLEYVGTTVNGMEKLDIVLKITSNEIPNDEDDYQKDIEKEIELIRARVKRIKEFLAGWRNSAMMKALDKAHVALINPPIKRTNVILKNPNFQVAYKLWSFLQNYDENDEVAKSGLDTSGNELLKGIMDDSFLMNYFVLDSISASKKEQKNKLSEYAIVMIHQQIQRIVSMLLNNGMDITDEEIMNIIANEIKNQRTKVIIDTAEIKNKFKNAFEEYLEKTHNYF